MSQFIEALHAGRVLLMDGAMGTELQRAGCRDDDCCELWNLTHPQVVRAIHQEYVDAGADVVLTNTFQANPWNLDKHGARNRLDEVQRAAQTLAREAGGRFVLADVGPVPADADISDPRAFEATVPDLGAIDALLLETWSDPLVFFRVRQGRIASWSEDVPILLSLTYLRDEQGRLMTPGRHPPEWFAMQAKANGVAALGVNCGRDIGIDDVIQIVRRYRQVTPLPLFARPNAGTPTRVDGQWVYPLSPEQFAQRLPELLAAGVSMVGGCCGTTPAHIAALRPVVDDWNRRRGQIG